MTEFGKKVLAILDAAITGRPDATGPLPGNLEQLAQRRAGRLVRRHLAQHGAMDRAQLPTPPAAPPAPAPTTPQTALQVYEHLQSTGESARAGEYYLENSAAICEETIARARRMREDLKRARGW